MSARWPLGLALASALALAVTPAHAQRACVEGPSVYNGSFDPEVVRALAAQRVSCVHVRLRQDVWTGLDDTTRRGTPPRTMREAWDALIDLYRSNAIDVILEVGADALGRSMHELRDPAARRQYAALFVRVVGRYVRQVKAFELADQPDLAPPPGVSGATALGPEDFAALALTTREALHRDLPGSLCNHHALALGGLRFTLQPPGLTEYLQAVLAAGLGRDGSTGLWTEYRAREGRLPFDAIAVRSFPVYSIPRDASQEGGEAASSAASDVGNVLRTFFNDRPDAVPIWIVASGLRSNGTVDQNTRQSQWLQAFFRTATRDPLDPPVALASWYTFLDPPWDPGGPRNEWGFYDDGVLNDRNARAALVPFRNAMEQGAPRWHARLTWADPPLRLAPGQTASVHLRIVNASTSRPEGTWQPGTRIRVGAAPSCPYAEEINQVRWTRFPSGGSSGNGTAEARVEVPFTSPWPPEISQVVEWEITAPTEPGTYKLSARLIEGEDRWFGQNSTALVEVVAPAMDAATDAPAPPDATAPPSDQGAPVDIPHADRPLTPPAPTVDSSGCGCSVRRARVPNVLLGVWLAVLAIGRAKKNVTLR